MRPWGQTFYLEYAKPASKHAHPILEDRDVPEAEVYTDQSSRLPLGQYTQSTKQAVSFLIAKSGLDN